jgi:SAM-dependent methyltransferase
LRAENKIIYDSVNPAVFSLVPVTAERILDIGCGSGALGGALRTQRQREIVGITYSPQEADLAKSKLSGVICAELNTFDFSGLGTFDCVVMSHILEHLYAPEDLLKRIKVILRPNSAIVVALPNVVWWKQRLEFLVGKWRYRDFGILDRTHFRFFDLNSSREMLEDAGYEIVSARADGPFPLLRPWARILLGGAADPIDRLFCRLSPGLFAFQFSYLARIRKSDSEALRLTETTEFAQNP